MAFEHKEGQGSLFKNEKLNDRQPDFKGTIMIQGVTYEIAAWEKTSQRGTKFLSLQASLPRDRQEQAPQPRQAAPTYRAPEPEPMYEPAPAFEQEPFEDLPF